MAENLNLKTVTTVDTRPFKKLVMTIGELPSSFIESMTYYELLAWFTNYLETVIIPTVNNNGEAVEELQQKFIELKSDTEEEIDDFEDEITTAFNTLKNFVDTYFDSLDVQEEINNKLDEMAEDGTLQEIITTYIQSNVAWTFDTVTGMKAATNLTDGSFAQTLGYYAVNDGGGALYKITDTVPSGYYETLDSGLYAELIIKDCMNIKQFGCKGDDTNNDTTKFDTALNNCKKIFIPTGTYHIDRFLPKENQEIIGVGSAIIKLVGTTAPLCELSSNLKLENLHIVSGNENLAWNRCNISNKEDITITNCIIEGFRHDSQTPNAWGILIGESSRVTIDSCYFDNNSQSDIAIGNGAEQINIKNCSGSNFFINLEPNNLSSYLDEITIEGCKLHQLNVLENNYLGTAIRSLLVSNCYIDILKYDGGTTTLVNTFVGKYINEVISGIFYGGVLKHINSNNFSNNLLSDPYLDEYNNATTSSSPWYTNYVTTSTENMFTSISDENGVQFVINPNAMNSASAAIKHQDINISENESYMLKVNGKINYPSTATYISLIFAVRWIDANGTQISQQNISMFRSSAGSSTPFIDQCAILVPPANATKLRLMIYSGLSAAGSQINDTKTIYLRNVQLFRINNNQTPNNIVDLPIRSKREFTSDVSFTANFNKYLAGDIVYYKNPTTYIGKVATTDGYGTGATWKNFGALAS